MASEPRANAFGQRVDVAIDAQHLLARVFARGDRIAGVRRIDEYEIEMLEPRFRIVGDEIGRLRHRAVIANDDTLGSERAEVQPDRRGARSAVEDETDRTGVRRRIGQEHIDAGLFQEPLHQICLGGRSEGGDGYEAGVHALIVAVRNRAGTRNGRA